VVHEALISKPQVADVRRRGQLYVELAALMWSSAGVLQRELSVSVATQVAGRACFLAIFDGPARAIRCAYAIRDRVRELGLEVRAGLRRM
jgi:hypothetical protein